MSLCSVRWLAVHEISAHFHKIRQITLLLGTEYLIIFRNLLYYVKFTHLNFSEFTRKYKKIRKYITWQCKIHFGIIINDVRTCEIVEDLIYSVLMSKTLNILNV